MLLITIFSEVYGFGFDLVILVLRLVAGDHVKITHPVIRLQAEQPGC
jgi:hypothetical protein